MIFIIFQFVRIRPGSMLQLLYPCSRYSVDKCLLCGGTFRDHLTLWWSKHLYTPYDRYLDQVFHESLTNTSTVTARRNDHWKRKITRTSPIENTVDALTELGYHRQYVLDVTSLFDNISKPKDRAKKINRMMQQRFHPPFISPHPTDTGINFMEQRTWPRYSSQSKIKYMVPRHDVVNNDGVPTKSSSTTDRPSQSFLLWFARDICLDAIDQLLDIQYRDRRK
jgi:hypothetical protein